MESDESSTYSGCAGNSRCPTSSQDVEDSYISNENQIKQETHNKIRNDEDDIACKTGERGMFCNYESDTNSETSESSDEDASDVFSETYEGTDNELMDDDNGNDENGNIKEVNDERDIEDDEWESMDEDDDEDKKLENRNQFDTGMDSDSSNDHSERCPVCLNRFIGQTIGTPESCDHSFCLECLLEWSKNVNTCPVDRKIYNQILSRNELGGSILEKIPVSTPVVEDEPDDDDDDDVTYCEVCRQCDREDRLLLCDYCDNGYHCECLIPPLDHIPIVEWYCPRCIIAGNAEANTEENTGVIETPSHISRIHRAIARTQASESVRHRIQQRRITNGGARSRSTTVRRRKVRRRKRTTKKGKTRKSVKKQHSGIKQKSCKKSTRKPRRKRRKLSRRKRKTRRAVATTQPLIAPTIRKRIASKLGIHKPRPGQTLPQIKRPCPSRSLNAQRYDGGVPTVSLFGRRDDLDIVNEDYENSSIGGVATVQSIVASHHALAHYARLAGKHALTLERRIISASPLIARENIDVLGEIMQEQKLLYKRSHDVSIQRNGFLKVKSPNDGLEQKQETESSDDHGKGIHGNPENEEGSKNTEPKGNGQSTSSNVSSSVDMFDSDNADKHMDSTEFSHGVHHTNPKENKENKSRKQQQRRNILSYGALQLYSDVEDDEENEALWRPLKKKRNMILDRIDGLKPVREENSADQNSEIDKVSSSRNEKVNTLLHEAASSRDVSESNSIKNYGKVNTSVPTEPHDNEPISFGIDSDSGILQHLLEEKEQNLSELLPEEYDNAYKEKEVSDEKEKKEDSNEEATDDFTDIAPRINIAVLPKIPKIKREKDEKQEEEVNNESGRHSVLSKVDEGSQETRWNKLSRFSRDKSSADKTQSERSFTDHGSSRSKQENFRWSNDRNNRDNRHWRERDDGKWRDRDDGNWRDRDDGNWRDRDDGNWRDRDDGNWRDRDDGNWRDRDDGKWRDRDDGNWRDRDDGDHYRDRRHGDRQREHERWERPWKNDQRNRFDNYNYGNDNRKKYARDNRSSNFRDRKEFQRGRSGRSPLKEYSRDKDRNVGVKSSSTERDGMYRDIPNRNYNKKFSSYEDVSEIKKDTSQSNKCEDMIESDITNIENLNNDQCLDDDLLMNSPLIPSVSSLGRKRSPSPFDWDEKQLELEEIEARENFWKMLDESYQPMQCDSADNNANLTDPHASTGYRKLRSPSPPSPPENESYDPFDPTESPVHKSAANQLEFSLDIPLPDRNDVSQTTKSLENLDEKPMMVPPPPQFPQPSFDQSNVCNFVPRGSFPNVHIPPPNFIIHAVPRPPFGNMVPQPNMQPFNWSAPPPPPTILVPPMMRGNFLPPPLPPRMITPQCAQPQMSCLPPHGPPPGPPPGPLPMMTPRGIQSSGPFVPNLPPPPMQNLNLPPQIALTSIAHPPPPPPPPPSSMMTNTVQNSAPPPVIQSHPPHNAIPLRPLFIPPATTTANPPQDSSFSVTSNQVVTALHSPLAVSSSTSVQSTDFSNTITTVTVPTTTTVTVVQSTSKKNDATIPNSTAPTASELSKKPTNSETTNQATAPSDVTDIIDMEVDSPFSPTNSPIDFDDVSIASSSEKSTPSPLARDLILSSPRPKFLAVKHASEVSGPKSSTPLKTGNKSSNDLTITENSKSNKIISCGQSLLEEVWAKHILSDSSSKAPPVDPKKKPSEKIRVVRDASAKEALKTEGSSFKMDEDQLKILDEIPSSAVEMQVKEKYMKKLNRQERVIEEVKLALKPYYNRRDIDKEEYKEILRKCVPKICHNRAGTIIPKKIKILVEAYVEKFSYHRKKGKDKPFPNT